MRNQTKLSYRSTNAFLCCSNRYYEVVIKFQLSTFPGAPGFFRKPLPEGLREKPSTGFLAGEAHQTFTAFS